MGYVELVEKEKYEHSKPLYWAEIDASNGHTQTLCSASVYIYIYTLAILYTYIRSVLCS